MIELLIELLSLAAGMAFAVIYLWHAPREVRGSRRVSRGSCLWLWPISPIMAAAQFMSPPGDDGCGNTRRRP